MNIKSLAASALIATTSLFGAMVPAEARTPWIFVGESTSGERWFVRDIKGGTDGFTYFYDQDGDYMATKCSTGKSFYENARGKWVDLGYYQPGSMAEARYEAVCLGYRPRV